MLDDVLAHSANRQRTEQGGRGAFAGHVAERDSEAAVQTVASLEVDEAGIGKRVCNANSPPLPCRGAGESLMEGNARARRDGVAIAHDEGTFEMLRLFIPQHDAENMIVDKFLDAL